MKCVFAYFRRELIMALYPDSLYDFPNVSAYDSDLREVLAMLRGLNNKMREFEVVNKITNAGSWVITKQYKPWTIVSDNNTGYISVRPVPAGIEITNTDYWALVADYDIMITNLSERISALEHDVNMIKNRRFIFISDSYATYYTQSESMNYIELAASYYGLDKNDDYYDFHLSGAGFCRPGDQAFIEVLRSNAASVVDPNTITDIIVCGSANDQTGTYAEIFDNIGYFKTYALSVFPNARIQIGCFSKSIENAYIDALSTVYKAYTDAAKLGITYITHSECVMQQYQLFRADHLHPLEIGIYELAKYLGMYIGGKNIEVIRDLNYTTHTEFTYRSDGYFADDANKQATLYITQRNNAANIKGGSRGIFMYMKLNEPMSVQANGRQINNVCYLLDNCFFGKGGTRVNAPAWLEYTDGDGYDRKLDVILTFTNTLTSNGMPIDMIIKNGTGAPISFTTGQTVSIVLPGGITVLE